MRIAIVEDDYRIREGLHTYFEEHTDFVCVLAEESVEHFLTQMSTVAAADILLLDINLPGMSGIEGVPLIKKQWPNLAIIMLTIYSDSKHIFDALKAGADGYLLKNTPMARIKEGILQIQNEGAPMSPSIARKVISFFNPPKRKRNTQDSLTKRETQVLRDLSEGLTYQQVGDKNFISIETVRHHVKNIYSKLHVHSKVEAVTRFLKGDI